MPRSRVAGEKPKARNAAALALRALTALVGGYVAAAGIASLLARLLSIACAEATAWGMILSSLVFVALGLWTFHEARLSRVVLLIWGSAVACIAITLLLGPRP